MISIVGITLAVSSSYPLLAVSDVTAVYTSDTGDDANSTSGILHETVGQAHTTVTLGVAASVLRRWALSTAAL